MGRKSQSKQISKKNANSGKENNKYLHQKRKELGIVVDKLLKLTSTFQATISLSKSWDHFLEIDCILREIVDLEYTIYGRQQNKDRQSSLDNFHKWLSENDALFEGIGISEFEGYDLGLQAWKVFNEGSLLLTVPRKLMITEADAKETDLGSFISVDPLLQNMPNITLAFFLLLQKNNPDSFWKPYIDVLPEKYTTVLYFSADELSELKPSPVFEQSLKLCRSIARQYAYFYNKIHVLDLPVTKKLKEVFSYESYRWAVSTVMTRQNNIQLSNLDTTAFIPLWDLCNHENGKITTDFNTELNRGECFALRDFKEGEQIFIFYGARPNADLFLHNGFVYPSNERDSVSLALGVSAGDPLRETKLELLSRLGLSNVAQYSLYKAELPLSAELLAFIRIFNMNKEELESWASKGLPSDLVSCDPQSCEIVGAAIDRRAYNYLLTRCGLLRSAYGSGDSKTDADNGNISAHRKNIALLKECEVKILEDTVTYLKDVLSKLPTESKTQ